jgi:hypothetical protein
MKKIFWGWRLGEVGKNYPYGAPENILNLRLLWNGVRTLCEAYVQLH